MKNNTSCRRILEYEKVEVIVTEKKETKEIGIQTDETPEQMFVDSMNDMRDDYLKLERIKQGQDSVMEEYLLDNRELYDVIKRINSMLKNKRDTRKNIIEYSDGVVKDSDYVE